MRHREGDDAGCSNYMAASYRLYSVAFGISFSLHALLFSKFLLVDMGVDQWPVWVLIKQFQYIGQLEGWL